MALLQNYIPGRRPLSKAPSRPSKPHPHPFLQGNNYPVFEETPGNDGLACEVIYGEIPEGLEGSMYIRTGQNAFEPPPEGTPHHLFDSPGMLHGIYFMLDGNTGSISPRYFNRFVRSEFLEKDSLEEPLMISIGAFFGGWLSFPRTILYLTQRVWNWCKKDLNNFGSGNTAVAFHNARLLALHEQGLPVEATLPQLETLGTFFFQNDGEPAPKSWPIINTFTAHPKIDPVTGDMVAFSYNIVKPPYMTYSVIGADGSKKIWQQPIHGMNRPVMAHDFAISEKYAIVLDLPTLYSPLHILRGKSLLAFRQDLPSRFGVFPRNYNAARDKHNVIWFETESCFIYHTATAWDEKDDSGNIVAVCMTACRSKRLTTYINQYEPHPKDGRLGGGPTIEEYARQKSPPGSGRLEDQDLDANFLTYFRFDLVTRRMYTMTLSPRNLEFPTINFDHLTRPDQRFVYLVTFPEFELGMASRPTGLVKIDTKYVIDKGLAKHAQKLRDHRVLEQQKRTASFGGWNRSRRPTVFSSQKEHHLELGVQELFRTDQESCKSFYFGGQMYGGECSFVPRSGHSGGPEAKPEDEDNGYLLLFVYDESQLDDKGLEKEGIQQHSELWILDATKMGGTHDEVIVCKIRVSRRIPYGFHGLWVDKAAVQANMARRSVVAV